MKTIYQISTAQFEYIQIEEELYTQDEAVERYYALKDLYSPPSDELGLPVKEYNKCLDQYVIDGTGVTELYLRMSKDQQRVFQELKKCFKRLAVNK